MTKSDIQSELRRFRRETGYKQLSIHAPQNVQIGPDALAILWYLLSKPDGWKIKETDLRKRFGKYDEHGQLIKPRGRDWYQNAMRQLSKAGYIFREKKRGPGGMFIWTSWIADVPVDWETELTTTGIPGYGRAPLPDSPVTAEPYDGQPAHIDTIDFKYSENLHNKDIPPSLLTPAQSRRVAHQERFEIQWALETDEETQYLWLWLQRNSSVFKKESIAPVVKSLKDEGVFTKEDVDAIIAPIWEAFGKHGKPVTGGTKLQALPGAIFSKITAEEIKRFFGKSDEPNYIQSLGTDGQLTPAQMLAHIDQARLWKQEETGTGQEEYQESLLSLLD